MEGQLNLFPILVRKIEQHAPWVIGEKDWRGCLFTNDYSFVRYCYADSREELIKEMDNIEEKHFKEKE